MFVAEVESSSDGCGELELEEQAHLPAAEFDTCFMAWLTECDDQDAQELTRICQKPRKEQKKAYRALKRKTDIPSHTAPMWRDIRYVFDENTHE